ncbi:MAG: hypothetical protein BRC29_04290 [Nanohaloarchaea archaeon SW_7_43_1]|nr:MAG: hypothetical protein BRC29_04290 [Nanohaloarchaea archaeon SW_7_43_1]
MSDVWEVLVKSFGLLKDEPRLFVPKIFSTLAASLFLVYLISSPWTISQLNPSIAMILMFASLLMLSIMGVYSSMMLSVMVKSSETSLYNSFIAVMRKYSNVLKASAATIVAGLIISVVFTAGYLIYSITGNVMYLIFAAFFFIIAVLITSYLGYFLPVTLVIDSSFREALGSSMEKSNKNRKVVTALLVSSFLLVGLAFYSAGFLEKLGYIGFVAGRLVSSVVNTYIFTVSPTFYFEQSGSESFQ